jgi:hypothetical protein
LLLVNKADIDSDGDIKSHPKYEVYRFSLSYLKSDKSNEKETDIAKILDSQVGSGYVERLSYGGRDFIN